MKEMTKHLKSIWKNQQRAVTILPRPKTGGSMQNFYWQVKENMYFLLPKVLRMGIMRVHYASRIYLLINQDGRMGSRVKLVRWRTDRMIAPIRYSNKHSWGITSAQRQQNKRTQEVVFIGSLSWWEWSVTGERLPRQQWIEVATWDKKWC